MLQRRGHYPEKCFDAAGALEFGAISHACVEYAIGSGRPLLPKSKHAHASVSMAPSLGQRNPSQATGLTERKDATTGEVDRL